MKIEAQDFDSGRKFMAEAPELDKDAINDFFDAFRLSEKDIKSWIDDLDVSADAKAILYKIGQTNIRGGRIVIKIGRKILEVVCFLLREFPKATFGLIFGAVVGFLVTSIPVIGFAIGPLFKALAMACGLVFGFIEDVNDMRMRRNIMEAMMSFETLRTK